jgi:hypothetical protein
VSTFLTIGYESFFRGAHEQAGIVRFGIDERERSADGKLIGSSNRLDARFATSLAQEIAHYDPKLAGSKRQASQHHEFGEVAARDVMGFRPVNRKVLAPLWLFVKRSTVRRNRQFFPLAPNH